MAELYRHTDIDGDRLEVNDRGETFGGREALQVVIGDPKGWTSAVYLDRDAALRLVDALVNHYGSKDSIEEEARRG